MTQYFHDFAALCLKKRSQQVTFLVGAPLSAPTNPGKPGVPGVEGVIDLIKQEFAHEPEELHFLDEALASTADNRYQAAFVFMQGRRGQRTANEIVRKAVLAARTGHPTTAETDTDCWIMENDHRNWEVAPGVESLGKLAVDYPDSFGRSVLTTNFDPLIEVAIQRAGGVYFRTTLHSDGGLNSMGNGCHIIHLHGYWFGADTLHTDRQLKQSRPRLKASLASVLRDRLVVVCGYGGWDDAFTEALVSVVNDDTSFPEILWTVFEKQPSLGERLLSRLEPGIDRGRVTLYSGIDCNDFFPALYKRWKNLDQPSMRQRTTPLTPVQISTSIIRNIESSATRALVLEGDDEDRPPLVDVCVGRESELGQIRTFSGRVVFVTGIGGQGKSTVAAQFFMEQQTLKPRFTYYVWRDCKEEGERFELQLAAVVERLSGGKITGKDLAQQSGERIVEILLKLITDVRVLFVFDNVDHHVDLERRHMTGTADYFVKALLVSLTPSQVLFTCRPSVRYFDPMLLNIPLQGIDLVATQRLFRERKAEAELADIERAHRVTNGHAFWLDLLAVQASKHRTERDLKAFVNEIGVGGGPLPDQTLNSIWQTLSDREQSVLRAMAETVKPSTVSELGDYLAGRLNFNKVSKAVKSLRALNLIVVKHGSDRTNLLELHPLVRTFVRKRFPHDERTSYIDGIVGVYKRFIGTHKSSLSGHPPLSLLQYWTQNAELDIAANRMSDAFLTLAEVTSAFERSAYPREFTRTVRSLLKCVDWVHTHDRYHGFEKVFKGYISILGYLGEHCESDGLLDQYEESIQDRDARFINYCNMRCNSLWLRESFGAAVEWGKRGRDFKESSGVDTSYDTTHSLALAERDAGDPDSALVTFLGGRQLSEVTDPKQFDPTRTGDHYGNIGRCLQLMGQVDAALVCYQKSALLIVSAGI
jgi:hypothetical protein